MDERVIAIVGPTASGKTALSVQLAELLNGEIINGDSMQVYEQLDIGTAKIKEEETNGIPHHLFDYKKPDESFSVSDYQTSVRQTIDELFARKKQPIVVGGTGMYIQAVLYDYRFTEEGHDPLVRERLEREAEENGREALYERLLKMDPDSARSIHPNNVRRVVRALEIIEVTGKTKKEHEASQGHEVVYPHLLIGLTMDRERLYRRIDRRVEQMIEEGLEEEVRALYDAGLKDAQSMSAIGYKEWIAYFEGKETVEDVVRNIQRNTRRYAKRQMTYFNNKLPIEWIDATLPVEKQVEEALRIIKNSRQL